jgi:hypothetical protein
MNRIFQPRSIADAHGMSPVSAIFGRRGIYRERPSAEIFL